MTCYTESDNTPWAAGEHRSAGCEGAQGHQAIAARLGLGGRRLCVGAFTVCPARGIHSQEAAMRARLSGPWQHPEFLKLWGSDTISVFGVYATSLALPLTAVGLGASAYQVGLLTTA